MGMGFEGRRRTAIVAFGLLIACLATPARADLIVPGQPYRPHRRPDRPLPKPIRPVPIKRDPKPQPPRHLRPMSLLPTVFEAGGPIPQVHTCEGADTSPPIAIADVPSSAQTLALIVDDPDAPDPKAPKRTWVHWVLWNLPPTTRALVDDAGSKGLPEGTSVGRNDWDKAAWGGPCPPIGRHRYVFKLYALDTPLPPATRKPWTKAELERAMEGHILASAQLIGTYEKVGGAHKPAAGGKPGKPGKPSKSAKAPAPAPAP